MPLSVKSPSNQRSRWKAGVAYNLYSAIQLVFFFLPFSEPVDDRGRTMRLVVSQAGQVGHETAGD